VLFEIAYNFFLKPVNHYNNLYVYSYLKLLETIKTLVEALETATFLKPQSPNFCEFKIHSFLGYQLLIPSPLDPLNDEGEDNLGR